MKTKVKVCKNCGFCFGASRAFNLVVDSTKKFKNIAVRGDLLHNEEVISTLKNLGVLKKEKLEDFKKKDLFVVRAHGEPLSTFEFLKKKGINYIDCTCPIVSMIHNLVKEKSGEGYKIIIVGNRGKTTGKVHAEVEGTSGWSKTPALLIQDIEDAKNIDSSFDKYFLVVQTTFSELKAKRIIGIIGKILKAKHKIFEFKDTCCNAQKEVNRLSKKLAKEVDIMLVIGGKNSHNTKEIYDTALKENKDTYFVSSLSDTKKLKEEGKLKSGLTYGLTAGTSTMPETILKIKEFLEKMP